MDRLSIEEIHFYENEMLKETADFLEKNGIAYILSYGTLLGAVRHKGFIPWDDDIDLLIPRDDYEKLKHLIDSNGRISSCIKFQCPGDKNFPNPFIKVINLEIKVVDEYANDKFPKYLWLDLFPLDHLPNERRERLKTFKQINWLHRVLAVGTKKKGKLTFLRIIGRVIYYIYGGTANICKKIDKICMKINEINATSNYLGCAVFPEVEESYFPKELIFPLDKLMFEDREYSVPENYDENLKFYYGDYMKFPPEEQRVRHHIRAYK